MGKHGRASLHLAALYNSKETAAYLLQRGADIKALDKYGRTPLHPAALNNSKETAAYLLTTWS